MAAATRKMQAAAATRQLTLRLCGPPMAPLSDSPRARLPGRRFESLSEAGCCSASTPPAGVKKSVCVSRGFWPLAKPSEWFSAEISINFTRLVTCIYKYPAKKKLLAQISYSRPQRSHGFGAEAAARLFLGLL